MKIYKNIKGQTLIETALVLVILLVILLGITEFSRAWFTKNSLKNAVRQGARVAVVTTPPIANFSSLTCPNSDNVVISSVCSQPGVPAGTNVTLNCSPTPCTSGSTVRVQAVLNNPNFFIVGGGIWPWGKGFTTTVDASMRYE